MAASVTLPRPSASILGVLIAGGRSVRMGEDKVGLVLEGVALWKRQVSTLQEIGAAEVVAALRVGQASVPGLVCLRDAAENLGPLGGLHAALEHGASSHVAALAIDLPGVDKRWFTPLLDACAPRRGAVYRNRGYFEPLAAVYPAEALPAARARVASRRLSLQSLCSELVVLGQLAVLDLPDAFAAAAANLNTPADLAAWRAANQL